MNKSLLYVVSMLVLPFLLVSFSTQRAQNGEKLYSKKCAFCHGKDGTKGFLGAKNLQKSKMDTVEIKEIIEKGKKMMPSFKSTFTADELDEVVKYVKNLQK